MFDQMLNGMNIGYMQLCIPTNAFPTCYPITSGPFHHTVAHLDTFITYTITLKTIAAPITSLVLFCIAFIMHFVLVHCLKTKRKQLIVSFSAFITYVIGILILLTPQKFHVSGTDTIQVADLTIYVIFPIILAVLSMVQLLPILYRYK
jgi:hypothetical protein